jgi:hypothetical protein
MLEASKRLEHCRALLGKFAVRLSLGGKEEKRRLSAKLCGIQA